MFENTTHFDFDDDIILDTSFSPTAIRRTQTSQKSKRLSQELDKENFKKLKLEECSSFLNAAVHQTSIMRSVSSDSFSSPNRVLKRKFPGPAGLLPEIRSNNKSILQLLETDQLDNEDVSDMPLLSQQTNLVFEDGPWKEMTEDFREQNENLFERFNIKWIKKQALKQLLNHKAPFLAAVIQNLDIVDGRVPTINVTLKDASGEIRGTILHSLYDTYSNYFRIGSVLVLKQFGVLSAGYNNYCLTITNNNLVSIYHLEVPRQLPKNDNLEKVYEESCYKGPIKKIVVQDCNVKEILKKYDEDMVTYSQEQQRKVNFGNLYKSSPNESRSFSFESRRPTNNKILSLINHKSEPNNESTVDGTKVNIGSDFYSNTNDIENSFSCTSSFINQNVSPVKKKFNFANKTHVNSTTKFSDNKKSSRENKACDSIIISSSQISVKPDCKEHTEIWKNLLEDVDTDSLFDDF